MKAKIRIMLSVILLMAGDGAMGQGYTWKQKANFPGVERYGCLAFTIGQTGYVGGGYNITNKSDFWAYDQATNTWMQKSNLPVAVRMAGAFAINNLGYFTGGILSTNQMNPSLYEYDPVANQWIQKSTFPGAARYGVVSFAIGTKGYIGLGNSGTANGPFHDDLYEYDPANNQWSVKATFPGLVRYGSFGISNDTVGYVGFGYTNPSSGNSQFHNDWWKFDPVANAWSALAAFPGPARSYPAGMVLNGEVFLGTGFTSGNVYLNDFYKYNPTTNQWTALAAFPGSARFVASFFTINGKAYWSNGTSASTLFNDLWEYSADSAGSVICVTLKPDGTTGKDALVLSGLPNTNTEPVTESIAVAWTCQGNPCVDRALIEFDFSFIPSNATILSALLNLYAHPNPITTPTAMYGTNNSCFLRRITSPWQENTVTWNTQPATTTQNQVILPHTAVPNQDYLNIDVKALVQDHLLYPASSFGFMIMLQNEVHYNAKDFASSDHPNPAYHPSIEVCYVTPVSVNEVTTVGHVLIYPNPVMDNELYIETTALTGELKKITLLDASGKVIRFSNHPLPSSDNRQQTVLNVELLRQGFYLIKIETTKQVITRPVIRL
jgi:N-acetylneuraminic acid mutarotase